MYSISSNYIFLYFLLFLLHLGLPTHSQTTIVGWDFSGGKYNNYGVCTNSDVIINSNGSFVSSIGCDNGSELMNNMWRREKKWVSGEFSTIGFENITISFWNKNFGGGYSGTWACQYYIGGDWVTIVTYSITSGNCGDWAVVTDADLPAEVANQPAVQLRWGWDSGLTYQNGGGNRLDNVFVKGTRDCDITVSGVETIKASCPNTNNGRITISAVCPACCQIQYSIDNGNSWQSSNLFNNVGAGNHTVKVRDKDFTGCVAAYGANPAVVSSEPDEAPVADCKDFTIVLNGVGNGSLTGNDIDNNSTDDCGIVSRTPSKTSFNCTDVGAQLITLTIKDGSNSTSTCQATVTVEDNIDPVAICQDITAQLDENGDASIAPQQVNNGSSDACGIGDLSLDQSNFACNTSSSLVTLSVTDNHGNTSDCTATVTIVDQIPPTASCNDLTINFEHSNTNNLTAAHISIIAQGSSDNCAGLTTAVTSGPTAYTCNDVGNNFILTLTATDASSNSSTCSANVTIADPDSFCNEPPVAICQDITISVNDNCEISITANLIDNGSSDPNLDELTYSLSNEGPFAPGSYSITLMVDDGEYTSSCTAQITVEDNTNPVAVCKNPTVTFNGETSIDLDISDIWDEAASSDNCGAVTSLGQDISSVNCSQIGQTVPVLVTIEDVLGNEATCTANVMVSGLPCGWTVDQAGMGCDSGQADYDTSNGDFTLTSEGCYDPSYYRLNDAQGFVQQTLCGDGEIKAQITAVTGNGWAGLSMRESNDPSAPMIQLVLDGVSMSRRELRQTFGNYAFAHMYPTNGKNWLRISRSGNQFTASRSADGLNWEHVFITQIPMANCMVIGLITMNGNSSGEVNGVFENVSVSGSAGNTLTAPPSVESIPDITPEMDFSMYPNPATDELNIQLDLFVGKDVKARIYNRLGQIIRQFQWTKLANAIQQVDISDLQAGTYIMEITNGREQISKKLVIVRL